jgi:hypothetical protein
MDIDWSEIGVVLTIFVAAGLAAYWISRLMNP